MFLKDYYQALFGLMLLVYEAGHVKAYLGDPVEAYCSTVELEVGCQTA